MSLVTEPAFPCWAPHTLKKRTKALREEVLHEISALQEISAICNRTPEESQALQVMKRQELLSVFRKKWPHHGRS
jgi:hypothetical protein